MAKFHSASTRAIPEGNDDQEDDEAGISRLFNGSLSFPGEQHFNEIMHKKMRPKKVAKFKALKRLETDY